VVKNLTVQCRPEPGDTTAIVFANSSDTAASSSVRFFGSIDDVWLCGITHGIKTAMVDS
jgi:hypothetical protein